MTAKPTPYDELDPNITDLVRILNSFPGIETVGSCGGHPEPKKGGWPAGSWYVKFRVARNDHGWFAPEFLAWAVNCDYATGHSITLCPVSPPPYLNFPGRNLSFVVEGRGGEDPNDLSAFLDRMKRDCYIAHGEWE